ncbi:MAG TPA: AI-2E family transporter [Vicinamibacterales bacterium]|nr:AI-2E family transporter [Vicinamibacterales bacterium]
MHRNVTSRLLFVLLLFFVLWSALRVIAPFLAGLTWAAVLVVTFRPFHRRLVNAFRGRKWAATAVVTLLVAAFVLVPVTVAAVQALEGAAAAYESARQLLQPGSSGEGLGDRAAWLQDLADRGIQLVGLSHVDLRAVALAGLQRGAQFFAVQGPALVGGALGLAFSFLVMIIGLPLLFSHGEALSASLAETLPIPMGDATRILGDIGDMTRGVFTSVGLTAAIQAALIGLALLVLGAPRPLPLAALSFFLAILPGGVALVWAPVALWLAAQGHTWSAAAMAVWGGGVVGTIDNVLRPLLAGRNVRLDNAALFFGMVGGMIAFGVVGLFLGPVALYAARELAAILRRDIFAEPVGSLSSGPEC